MVASQKAGTQRRVNCVLALLNVALCPDGVGSPKPLDAKNKLTSFE